MYHFVGVLFIVVYGIFGGASPIFARISYGSGADPITFLFLRFVIASVFLVPLIKLKGVSYPRGQSLLILILMGAVAYVVMTFGYFTALTMVSASLVVILVYTYPVFVILISRCFFGEPITIRKTGALCLAIGGIILLVGLEGGGKTLGIFLALAASLFYALYTIFGSRVMRKGDAFSSSTVIILSTAAVYGGLVLVRGAHFPTTTPGWISIIAIALLSTVIGYLLFFSGLKRIGPTVTSIVTNTELVVAVILSVVFLEESITFPKLLGGTMILSAVLLLAKKETESLNA